MILFSSSAYADPPTPVTCAAPSDVGNVYYDSATQCFKGCHADGWQDLYGCGIAFGGNADCEDIDGSGSPSALGEIKYDANTQCFRGCTGAGWKDLGQCGRDVFISTWKTDNLSDYSSAANQVSLPLRSGNHDFIVEWGDGTSDHITSHKQDEVTHTYPAPGTYTIKIKGTIEGWGFTWDEDNGLVIGDHLKLMNISQWGALKFGAGPGGHFQWAENMTITATDVPDTSAVTDMSSSFSNCYALSSVPNMGKWDMSNVTRTEFMFTGAALFNENLNEWDTSKVTNMNGMFFGASSFNSPIGNWDVSKVTNMGAMFSSATAFNQPLNSWNTASLTNISFMFQNATNFNQPLNNWNTSKITLMNSTFSKALAFNQPLNNWNTGLVTAMNNMFNNASSFNQNLTSWNTANVTNMSGMFQNASAYISLGPAYWNISNVTHMNFMFQGSGLGQCGYESILQNWSSQTVKPNVNFHAGSARYIVGHQAYKNILTGSPNNWVITDGGTLPSSSCF